MNHRMHFITDHQRGLYDMTELCVRNYVSRNIGYKWLARYAAEGARGLIERSHAPHLCPHRIADALAELLITTREAHPTWGPAKLVDYLQPRHRQVPTWPAISTVADLLKRQGLITPRRSRRAIVHPGTLPIRTSAPNDLWTADFKWQFRTRNGVYCFPLTIADKHTRYLLCVHGLLTTRGVDVRPLVERAFREHGLPLAIRTDNGVPFANTGLRGLTQLNVWWLRLGIQHQRIRPASPQENGAHGAHAPNAEGGNDAAPGPGYGAAATGVQCMWCRPHQSRSPPTQEGGCRTGVEARVAPARTGLCRASRAGGLDARRGTRRGGDEALALPKAAGIPREVLSLMRRISD